MKPLLVNTSDIHGGAARAAYRLHQGLQRMGIASRMLVQWKSTSDPAVVAPSTKAQKGIAQLRPHVDRLPLQLYPSHNGKPYHLQWVPDRLGEKISKLAPDLVHLHWICAGFVQIETLAKIKCPIVWTLHDMWAFTGGCHYSGACRGYEASCGTCPQLGSNTEYDLSRLTWKRKSRAWKEINLTMVTPSRWLAERARESTLFREQRIKVIPYGLDTSTFAPVDQQLARRLMNLPEGKRLIAFGAVNAGNQRKGIHLLREALHRLRRSQNSEGGERNGGDIEVVVFGTSHPSRASDLGFPVHYTGRLHDDISLVTLYSAADVFVAPSIEDNLPNTVMEALSCGTPAVAFDIGGMPDMIEHQESGYLADPYEPEDLANGIGWVLADEARRKRLSRAARKKAEREYAWEVQANSYKALYEKLSSKCQQ